VDILGETGGQAAIASNEPEREGPQPVKLKQLVDSG
jgi:hypothetical protein